MCLIKPHSIQSAAQIFEQFHREYSHHPKVVVRSPGRVNLVGAHVDTHEGWALPGTIDRAIWLAAAPGKPKLLRFHAVDVGESAEISTSDPPPPVPNRLNSQPNWSDYPAGIAWLLRDQNIESRGLDIVFGGDLPIGAGLGSSAALEMGLLLAWESISEFQLSNVDRARLGMELENRYLGLASGIMDQFACLTGEKDSVLYVDCRSLQHEVIPFPADTSVLVIDSGVRRRLSVSGYNDRVQECRQALSTLQAHLPQLQTLRDLEPEDFDKHRSLLTEAQQRRVRHVVLECKRVGLAAQALRQGDLRRLGTLMQQSHASSRDHYEVSTPELDLLVETAVGTEGCYGARLSGGGFGGCITALIERKSADEVSDAVRRSFKTRFDRTPEMFTCSLEAGAEVVTCDNSFLSDSSF